MSGIFHGLIDGHVIGGNVFGQGDEAAVGLQQISGGLGAIAGIAGDFVDAAHLVDGRQLNLAQRGGSAVGHRLELHLDGPGVVMDVRAVVAGACGGRGDLGIGHRGDDSAEVPGGRVELDDRGAVLDARGTDEVAQFYPDLLVEGMGHAGQALGEVAAAHQILGQAFVDGVDVGRVPAVFGHFRGHRRGGGGEECAGFTGFGGAGGEFFAQISGEHGPEFLADEADVLDGAVGPHLGAGGRAEVDLLDDGAEDHDEGSVAVVAQQAREIGQGGAGVGDVEGFVVGDADHVGCAFLFGWGIAGLSG